MGITVCRYLVLLLVLVLLIQKSLGDCSLSSNAFNKQYTINSWTGNWTFEGYDVGVNSGDSYYLLSSASQSQCGIIREDTSGTKVWAKTYSDGQCSAISIDATETYVYYINAYTTALAIVEVNCSDGSLNRQISNSSITLNGKINTLFYIGSAVEGYIFLSGDIVIPNNFNPSYITFNIRNDDFSYNPPNDASMDDLTHLIEYKRWRFELNFFVFINNASGYEINLLNTSQSTSTAVWYYNISCTSTCPTPDYAKSDYDQTNIHLALNLPSEGKALVMVLAVADGSLAGSLKTTQSSQQLTLGSLYANNDTITWISMYSTSSSYSELIKYDSANNNYTIYQQTGISYFLQKIDSSNNDSWFALGVTENISNSTQACISNVPGLTVSTTTSGFDDATSFSLGSVGTSSYNFNQGTVDHSTTTTRVTSDLTYNFVEVVSTQTNTTNQTTTGAQTNEDDDGLSTGEIVGIAVGSVFGLILIIVIAFVIIYIYRKTNNKYEGREEVKPDSQTEQQVDKNMSSERPEIIEDNMI